MYKIKTNMKNIKIKRGTNAFPNMDPAYYLDIVFNIEVRRSALKITGS
jgi:hypothetical protein